MPSGRRSLLPLLVILALSAVIGVAFAGSRERAVAPQTVTPAQPDESQKTGKPPSPRFSPTPPPSLAPPAAVPPEVEQPFPSPSPAPSPGATLPTAPAQPGAPAVQQTPILPPVPAKVERPAALTQGDFVPGEVLVLVPSAGRERLRKAGEQEGLDLAETAHLPTVDLIVGRYRLPEGKEIVDVLEELALILEGQKGVVQPNYYFEAQGVNESPLYHLRAIRAEEAQRLATGLGVTLALLDTPVDLQHPAYRGRVREDQRIVKGEPPGAHGTALAGVMAGQGSARGVAPEARLLSIPVCRREPDRLPRTTSLLLARGLDLALRWGVHGINLSLGGPRDRLVGLLVEEALKRKTILVAAAGNSGPKGKAPYPATHPGVIAVTAIDHKDWVDPRATHGPHVSLAAPGVDIITAAPGGGQQVATGTSLAAAHVSGVAALILERHPDIHPAAVKKLLEASARDLGPPGKDRAFGAGRVDALRALESLLAGKAPSGRSP